MENFKHDHLTGHAAPFFVVTTFEFRDPELKTVVLGGAKGVIKYVLDIVSYNSAGTSFSQLQEEHGLETPGTLEELDAMLPRIEDLEFAFEGHISIFEVTS